MHSSIQELSSFEGFAPLKEVAHINDSPDVQRQQLAQRIEIAKANLAMGIVSGWEVSSSDGKVAPASAPSVALGAAFAHPKRAPEVAPPVIERDFFGRPIQRKAPATAAGTSADSLKSPKLIVGVCFKFQEGFTNAVRRKVYTKDLL